MQNGRLLHSDPTHWLLEADNPSVRYWTLVDVSGRGPTDEEVKRTRLSILEQPLVKSLRESQKPEGHWGEDESKPYTAGGTMGVLSLVHMLGVPPDESITRACDSFLRFCQSDLGGFSMVGRRPSGVFPCTTGEHLPFLAFYGLSEDPRVRRSFSFLLDHFSAPGALDCGRYGHQDCLWGAIAALRGLAVLPLDMQTPKAKLVIEQLCDALLSARYDFDGEHKRWLSFGVPRGWDLISALKVLAVHGYARAARFRSLLGVVLERQDANGRWKCGSVSRTWQLEKRNQPSKWVTLDVLRVLKEANIAFA